MELIAERFRVLGEPMRIKLLNALREEELSVSELCAATGASQQNASKHLAILHQVGMVERSKDGNLTRYAISDPAVFELCEIVCGGMRKQVDELERVLGAADA